MALSYLEFTSKAMKKEEKLCVYFYLEINI